MRGVLLAPVLAALLAACMGGPIVTVSPPAGRSTTVPATASPASSSAANTSPGPLVSAQVTDTGIGADTFLLRDDFADPASGWDVGPNIAGVTAYVDGNLVISFDQVGSIWSNREFDARWNVMRMEGQISLKDAAGAAGFMCGESRVDHVGGVVNTSGKWFFVETADGNTRSLESGSLAASNPLGVYDVAVECAGTATGAFRWRLIVDGAQVTTLERPDGAADFGRAVAFASIGSVDFNAQFDDVTVYGGSQFLGFPPSFAPTVP